MKHLLAHNQKNLVKKGDRVTKQTPVATIGKGYRNEYSAHLHYSVSEGLSNADLKKYVSGWSKAKILDYFQKPKPDHQKMFGKKMNTTYGWGWLEKTPYGWHPGIDYNDPRGGDSDLGLKYNSPCNGRVIEAANWGKGWGKVIIVEEDAMQDESCELIKAELSHLKAKDKMMEDRINSLTKEKNQKDKENETLGRKVEALEEELEKTNQLVKKLKSNKSELRKRAESGAIVGSITVIVGYIVMQYDLPEEVRTAIIGLAVGIVTQITKYLHNLNKK